MRRLIFLTIATVLTLGGLYVANASFAPDLVVRFRIANPDPVELDRLIGVFDERVQRDPDTTLYRSTLGRLYLDRAGLTSDLGDYDRAIELLSSAEVTPELAVPLARAYLAVHSFDDALATIEVAPADSVATLTVTTDARLGLGSFAEAELVITRLERMHPSEPAILIRRAELALLTGDGTRAVEAADQALHYTEAARLPDADRVFYLSAAARHHLLAGDAREALGHAEEAVGLDAANGAAQLLLARAQAATGDLDQALASAERAASLIPDPTTLSFLADISLALGDSETSNRHLDTIEAIAKLDQPALRRSTALALAEHGRALQLSLAMAEAELTERDDPYAHHLMATVLHALGRHLEAETHAALAISIADPSVWFRAGLIALENGQGNLGVERLEAALDLSPNFHPVHAQAARQIIEELAP